MTMLYAYSSIALVYGQQKPACDTRDLTFGGEVMHLSRGPVPQDAVAGAGPVTTFDLVCRVCPGVPPGLPS